jgi:serine/threonine protein kinase
VLHADHEQNCSTTTARVVGSAHADPYVTVSAAASALYGPRHGGANEAVLRMLTEIGEYGNVDAFMDGVKAGDQKLMGFGHRVYKNYDPRARIVKDTAGSGEVTMAGAMLGSPTFMSPEQINGADVDGRSDIYSLATILYEALTGKLPFNARSSMEFVQLHVMQAPIPLDERIPDKRFPAGLGTVIAKALENDASAMMIACGLALRSFEQ